MVYICHIEYFFVSIIVTGTSYILVGGNGWPLVPCFEEEKLRKRCLMNKFG